MKRKTYLVIALVLFLLCLLVNIFCAMPCWQNTTVIILSVFTIGLLLMKRPRKALAIMMLIISIIFAFLVGARIGYKLMWDSIKPEEPVLEESIQEEVDEEETRQLEDEQVNEEEVSEPEPEPVTTKKEVVKTVVKKVVEYVPVSAAKEETKVEQKEEQKEEPKQEVTTVEPVVQPSYNHNADPTGKATAYYPPTRYSGYNYGDPTGGYMGYGYSGDPTGYCSQGVTISGPTSVIQGRTYTYTVTGASSISRNNLSIPANAMATINGNVINITFAAGYTGRYEIGYGNSSISVEVNP